jgi:hypothetical protein
MRYGFGDVIVVGVPNLLGVGGGVIDGVGFTDGAGVVLVAATRIGFELAF